MTTLIDVAVAAGAATLILGAAWLGGRGFRQMPPLPVAPTFRAIGVAAAPVGGRADVLSHRRVPGGHRGVGRAARRDVRGRWLVLNSAHRSAVNWLDLNAKQVRARVTVAIRGGAR